MHVVYKLTFTHRMSQNLPPYYYIGSKSNCTFFDGKMVDKSGKFYYGSSEWVNYQELVENDIIVTEILYSSDSYEKCISEEYRLHVLFDVVANINYFNKHEATISNYSNPNYATYKHKDTDKIVRLPRLHPLVLCGDYVGVTKWNILSDEHKEKIHPGYGVDNNFYGRSHSEETKTKLSELQTGNKHSEETKQKIRDANSGKIFTEEHKKKIGRSGFIILTNIFTKENIRIKIIDKILYDSSVWKNTRTLASQINWECEHCGKVGIGAANFKRWHNDNCKHKKTEYEN